MTTPRATTPPTDPAADAAAEALRARLGLADGGESPRLAIVCGSGLGALAALGPERAVVPYDEIPGLGRAGVAGHAGRWLTIELAGRPVAVLQGRRHLYEGIEPEAAGLTMRVLARLGARAVVLTNAAGGLGPALRVGDLMLIRDHLDLMFRPVRGAAPPPVAAADVYDPALADALLGCALEAGVALKEGVYAGVLGPSYETRAEAALLRTLGGDAVGMSTVPEALAAVRAGLRVAAVSLITNSHWHRQAPDSHAAVLRAAEASGARLARLLARFAANSKM